MPEKLSRRDIANRILLSLPQSTLDRLMPAMSLVKMTRGQVIDHLDQPIANLYFVNQGIVSLVKTMHDGRSVEVEAVGIEGVTGPNVLFGIGSAVAESIVQVPGTALRIRGDALNEVFESDDALHEIMERYAHLALFRIIQNAACNRLHTLEERCCRWLLIAHDSALSDTFPLTHEFLATMLGAQRAGVSITAGFLQKAGYIRYARGRVTVIDRGGLENAACECYSTVRRQLDELLPRPSRRHR